MSTIESVLRDAPPSVVVVVSDNSTEPDERRRLEDYCARGDERVRYVRPPEPLAMSAHWEWLWRTIRESVDPTHVAYVTDRMVLVEGALPQLIEVVGRHRDGVVSYHKDYVNDLSSPVELVQTPWTGRLVELDSRRLLQQTARGRYGDHLPLLLNCIAPAAVIEAIEKRFGDVFGTISPDYRFAFRCLTVCDTVLYLDRACLVEHGNVRSAGGNFRRGYTNPDAADFAAQLAEPRFAATPEPRLETLANAIFQEYCAVREEAGPDGFPAPDRRGYLTANAISIDRIENAAWQSRMRAVLRSAGWTRLDSARHVLTLALEMAWYLASHPRAVPRTLKRQLLERPPGTPAAFLAPRLGLDPQIRDELRFESDEAAVAHAVAHPRPPSPDAWHIHRLERAGAIVGEAGTPA